MDPRLARELRRIVDRFVRDVLDTVGRAFVSRWASVSSARRTTSSPRRARRPSADVAAPVERIATIVGRSPSGLRAEVLRERLKVSRNELARPLRVALTPRRIRKTGERRQTLYLPGRKRGARTSPPARKPAS